MTQATITPSVKSDFDIARQRQMHRITLKLRGEKCIDHALTFGEHITAHEMAQLLRELADRLDGE